MIRLRSLLVHRFRQMAAGSKVMFSSGSNLLLGMNGAGKTTLLDLLVCVIRGEFSALLPYGLDVVVELMIDDPLEGAQSLSMRIHFDPDSPDDDGDVEPRWAVEGRAASERLGELQFEVTSQDPRVRFGDVTSERRLRWPSQSIAEALHLAWSSVARAWPEPARSAAGTLFASWWLQTRNLGRLAEDLQTWSAVVDGVAPSSPTLVPPTALSVDDAETWYGHPLRPLELAHGWRDAEPTFSSPSFLQRFQAELGITDLSIRPRLQREATARSGRRLRGYLGMDLRLRWPDQSVTRQDALSFGQKRLFAILYVLASLPDCVVLADELVSGLHPELVELSLETIGDRQAILASQDPLLFDQVGFSSAEHVAESLVICKVGLNERNERVYTLRNPSAEEAWSFYRTYALGTRPVSEILRTMGLW